MIYDGAGKTVRKYMTDVGIVLCKKGDKPGVLDATWHHLSLGGGTGRATGGPAEGFVGRYQIRYFDDQDEVQAERELGIQKDGDRYLLTWISNGHATAKGIGIETAEGLVAAYRDLE